MMTSDDLIDPLLQPGLKGFPVTHRPVRRSEVGQLGWHVLAGDLTLPLAVLRQDALTHNIAWMQRRATRWGVDLAPHGKTTMSPQLFARQLDAGAWGITFATVTQLAVGVAAGVRNALVANQVFASCDLAAVQLLRREHPGLRAVFLVDSVAQLELIEAWMARHPASPPFEVLLEVGVAGGRTGIRDNADAHALAARLHASTAVQLVGIECYEGLGARGDDAADGAYAGDLMARVEALAAHCDRHGLFDAGEVIVSAGGSALFDLVAGRLTPRLGRQVRGLLRSGCYITHDHGMYCRMVHAVEARLGLAADESLRPALEVWACVQSRPEAGLAIVAAGKRDLSFDLALPVPIARAAPAARGVSPVPASWRIDALNDQHAYLRWDPVDDAAAPVVGERVGLGISHPCTTFDKWAWLPVVDADYRVVDAVTTHF